MFGMGGSEILVILIVALLFLGPDKLPSAAKTISKGIRDIKKQSRSLQQQIEGDEQIGGAIRDLKSALRGEDLPVTPRRVKPIADLPEAAATIALTAGPTAPVNGDPDVPAAVPELATADALGGIPTARVDAATTVPSAAVTRPTVTLPPTAGEADPVDEPGAAEGDDLAGLIKPASGTVAKGT